MTKRQPLSLAAMDTLLRQAGADRVSDSAKAELARALADQGRDIARKAIEYATHAKRKTVNGEDIRLATK